MIRTILRFISATVLVGCVAALAVGGSAMTSPLDPSPREITHSVQIPAGESILVCSAAPAVPDAVVDVDDDFAQVPADASASLDVFSFGRGDDAPAEAALGALGEAAAQLQMRGELRALSQPSDESQQVLTAQPVGDAAGLVSGTSTWSVGSGDLRSISASACQTPQAQSWLVAGSGEIGHSSTLTLTNPAQTPATVTITLYGPLGVIETPLLEGLVVAPQSTVEVLLEAHATDVDAFAAHVESSGAEISAVLAHSALDGLTPLGFDLATTSVLPTTDLLIPGVALTEDQAVDSDGSQETEAERDAVRIVNPSDDLATVSVELLGPEGAIVIPGAENVAISPGAVFELSLEGLPEGDYAVHLESDVAVTAGVILERGLVERDHTWIPATDPTTHATGAVAGAQALLITAPEDAEVTVLRWNADGEALEPRSIQLRAGTTHNMVLDDVNAVEVRATSGVAAAVVYEGLDDQLISVMPLTADANEQHSVDVRVVN